MPGKDSKATTEPSTFKFEVSASKLFHLNIVAALDKVNLDVGAGDYGKKVTIPVPVIVQNAGTTAYGYVAPYAEWSYKKFLKKSAE